MKILFHKVARMKDASNIAPKFSFNFVKMNVWVIKHYLAAGIQSILVFKPYFNLIFYWGYRPLCKKFAHFYQFFTCLINEIVCKTFALASTFKYAVSWIPKRPDFIAWLQPCGISGFLASISFLFFSFYFKRIVVIKKSTFWT